MRTLGMEQWVVMEQFSNEIYREAYIGARKRIANSNIFFCEFWILTEQNGTAVMYRWEVRKKIA